MKTQHKVQVMMNTELARLFNQTGQYEDLINGVIKCKCCGREITLDNISTLVPMEVNGEIKIQVYCNSIDCVNSEK